MKILGRLSEALKIDETEEQREKRLAEKTEWSLAGIVEDNRQRLNRTGRVLRIMSSKVYWDTLRDMCFVSSPPDSSWKTTRFSRLGYYVFNENGLGNASVLRKVMLGEVKQAKVNRNIAAGRILLAELSETVWPNPELGSEASGTDLTPVSDLSTQELPTSGPQSAGRQAPQSVTGELLD